MEEVEGALETKLTQLKFSRERTEKIIQSGKWDRVERHQNALKELAGEADQLKRKLEEMKIAAKENVDHVKKWSDEIETRIDEAEEDVTRLREWAETMKKEESQKLRDEELKYEQKLFETRLQFQSELKEAGKLQQAQGSGSGSGTGDVVAGLQAKLPKLVITKFNGTFQFWGQFCEAIDK